jgi:hypothetical protein
VELFCLQVSKQLACVKSLFYFLNFIVGSDTSTGTLQRNNMEWTPKHLFWHTLTTDNNFWGWMILVKGIPCVIIAARPLTAETEFILIHFVWHQSACRLSYYISYMHGDGISRILIMTSGVYDTVNGNSLCWKVDAANSNRQWTPNSLVLHQIDNGLSYFAFYMHKVDIYGLLIITYRGGWYW